MELDETDPIEWMKLEAATQEYVDANSKAFDAACDCLMPPIAEEHGLTDRYRTKLGLSPNGIGTDGGSFQEFELCSLEFPLRSRS